MLARSCLPSSERIKHIRYVFPAEGVLTFPQPNLFEPGGDQGWQTRPGNLLARNSHRRIPRQAVDNINRLKSTASSPATRGRKAQPLLFRWAYRHNLSMVICTDKISKQNGHQILRSSRPPPSLQGRKGGACRAERGGQVHPVPMITGREAAGRGPGGDRSRRDHRLFPASGCRRDGWPRAVAEVMDGAGPGQHGG